MSIDATKPTNKVLFSELDNYQRETRKYLNTIENYKLRETFKTLKFSYDGSVPKVGTDLTEVDFEIVEISASSAQGFEFIRGGSDGQIKVFVTQDSNITFKQTKDDSKIDGSLYMNAPAGVDLTTSKYDTITFRNVGGDGGTTNHGYWQELYRTIAY